MALSTQDEVTALMQPFTLSKMPSHLTAAETLSLSKLVREVHQHEGGQEVGPLLVPGIMYLANTRVQVPQDYGVRTQEAVKSLL